MFLCWHKNMNKWNNFQNISKHSIAILHKMWSFYSHISAPVNSVSHLWGQTSKIDFELLWLHTFFSEYFSFVELFSPCMKYYIFGCTICMKHWSICTRDCGDYVNSPIQLCSKWVILCKVDRWFTTLPNIFSHVGMLNLYHQQETIRKYHC
jgi:hypothetical protein